MVNRFKSSISLLKIHCLIQYLSLLCHRAISRVFYCAFVQSFTAKLILLTYTIVTVISFTTHPAQHFGESELLLGKSWFSLVMFLMFKAASTGGELFSASAILCFARQSLLRFSIYSARLLGRVHSSESFLPITNRRNLYPFRIFKFADVPKLIKKIVIKLQHSQLGIL